MSLKINEIKKHLERGDLLKAQDVLKNMNINVSYKHISAVLNNRRQNSQILSVLIQIAENNISQKEQLIVRAKSLKSRSKKL